MLTISRWPAPHPISKAATANPKKKGKDISFIAYLREVGFLACVFDWQQLPAKKVA
jgi:hypothetical protein